MLIYKYVARHGYWAGDPDYGNDHTATEGPDDEPVQKTPENEHDEEEVVEKEGAPEAKKRGIIPLERHEAVLARERERREQVENELKKYQGAQVLTQTNQEIATREARLAELDTEYADLMADAKTEAAAAVMKQIRALDREIMALDSQGKIAAAEARAVEQNRYSVALTRIEAAYPALDEDSEEYDEETYTDVLDLMRAYKAAGRTPTDALQRAVKMKLGSATAKQKDATSVKPRVDAAEETRTERKKESIDKVLAAVNKQPGTATAKTGSNNDADGAALTAKEIIKMSYSKFAKLNDEQLSKARGDDFVGS